MCSTDKSCTFNGLSTNAKLSGTSPLSAEQASSCHGVNSCSAPKIHSDDTTPTVDAEFSEGGATATPAKTSNTPWHDGLSLVPEDVPSKLFALCFAVELIGMINRLAREGCLGCPNGVPKYKTQYHTCQLRTKEKVIERFMQKALCFIDPERIRTRFRTFVYKPNIYGPIPMPDEDDAARFAWKCRTLWIHHIYDMILNDLNDYCPYAVAHARRWRPINGNPW